MPAGRMRLGTINVARFENAFEPGDSMLFIELRALGKVCHAVEIANREQVCAPFGTAANDLGGNNLREMMSDQKLAKIAEDRALDSKDIAHAFIPQSQRTMIEQY